MRLTAAAVQLVALVARAALRYVSQAAHGAAVVATDHTRDWTLAQSDARVAHACALALQEGAPETIFIAIEEGLHSVQPLQNRSVSTKKNEQR